MAHDHTHDVQPAGIPIIGEKLHKFEFAGLVMQFPYTYPQLARWLEQQISSGNKVGPDWMLLWAAMVTQREEDQEKIKKLQHRITLLEKRITKKKKG